MTDHASIDGKRVFIVVNRYAGHGYYTAWQRLRYVQLQRYLRSQPGTYKFAETRDFADIVTQTRRGLEEGFDYIVALGGDGTIHGAAHGSLNFRGEPINPNAVFVVTNFGTGCDLFRTVVRGAPKHFTWLDLLYGHRVQICDLGKVTFENQQLNYDFYEGLPLRYFLNIAAVGISADIVRRKDSWFRLPVIRDVINGFPPWKAINMLKYGLPSLYTYFLTYKPRPISILLDEKDMISTNLVYASFAKVGLYAGGGMVFGGDPTLPEGRMVQPDDGRFAYTVLEKGFSSLSVLAALTSGDFSNIPNVRRGTASHIRIFGDKDHRPVSAELDGEVVGTTNLSITAGPKINLAFFDPTKLLSGKPRPKSSGT